MMKRKIALMCALLLAAGLSLTVAAQPLPDTDTDGVPDSQDNCVLQQNASQGDSDLDGYGNVCDGDFDNDGIVFAHGLQPLQAELRHQRAQL